MKRILVIPAWIAMVFTLVSCGGGSSAPQQSSALPENLTTPTRVLPATVGLVLTDASAEDYDHAFATITSVELLGDGGNQMIFSGSQTVDLLSLRDTLQIFAVNENVVPGDFEKIRMRATDLVLVVDNEDGSTTETDVQLVANGKIDLNPRETITIESGEVVFISFDWDVNKSLKLTETGNGKIKMRPVIFVDIGTVPGFKEGLVRVSGVVEFVASDFMSFRLCEPDGASTQPVESLLNSMCIDVVINDDTSLFGEDGLPITVDGLIKGAPLTVLGILRRSMDGAVITPVDDEGNELLPTPFQISAIVIEVGAPGTWGRFRGTLSSAPDAMNAFDFLLDNGQGYPDDTVLTGQLFDATRIFRISTETGLTAIMPSELMVDDRAVVEAVADEAADPDVLNTAILLARTPAPDVDSISGRILSLDPATETLRLSGASIFECVTTDIDTNIFVLTLSDDSLESVAGTFEDLTVGSRVIIVGADDMAGCFGADVILEEGPAVESP